MSLSIQINNIPLLLPSGFSIEWEENNYAFEEDSVYGDYTIPVDLPIKGNEKAIGFAHEIETPNKILVLEGAQILENENVLYTGALALKNVRKKSSITASFLVHDFAYFYGEKKLNDSNLLPKISLGDTDAEVITEANNSIDGTKLYCFPPIKVDNFYGDSVNFPSSITGNFYDTSVTSYKTADDFSKPLIPFFFITQLTKLIANTAGYAVKGSFFTRPEFSRIAISNLASMDRHKNENDVDYTTQKQVGSIVPGSTYRNIAGHELSGYFDFDERKFYVFDDDCQVKEETDIKVSYQFKLPNYDRSAGAQEYEFNVRVILANDPAGLSVHSVIHTKQLKKTPPPLTVYHDIEQKVSFTHNTAAADVGKYLIVQAYAVIRYYNVVDNEPLNPFNLPTYVLTNEIYYGFSGVKIQLQMRYLGQTGSELIEPMIEPEFHFPDMTIEEFFVGLKKDYNLRFNFHPFRKELEINVAQDLLSAPIKRLGDKIHDDYELVLNDGIRGFEFIQEFDEETDNEKEEGLKYKNFLGEFEGTGSFPAAGWNMFVVDSISNEVYISKFTSAASIFGGSGTFSWEKSHQRIVNSKHTLGNGEQQINATFLPLFLSKEGSDYLLKYNGIGKSRDSGEKPDNDGFRAINFFGIDGGIEGWESPFASHLDRYIDGTQFPQMMVLNYDPDNPRSIFSLMYAKWINFMLNRLEMEVVLLHKEIDELDPGYRYEIEGALFLIKQIRTQRNIKGITAKEATLYKIP